MNIERIRSESLTTAKGIPKRSAYSFMRKKKVGGIKSLEVKGENQLKQQESLAKGMMFILH